MAAASGHGRKARRVGSESAQGRSILWIGLLAIATALILLGCPPFRGPESTTRPTERVVGGGGGERPSPPATNWQTQLGRAYLASARAHQALALGDAASARPALAEVQQHLNEAKRGATVAKQREILAIEQTLLGILGGLDTGGPATLEASGRLMDTLLALATAGRSPGAEGPLVPSARYAPPAPPSPRPARTPMAFAPVRTVPGGGAGEAGEGGPNGPATWPARGAPGGRPQRAGPDLARTKRSLARALVALSEAHDALVEGYPSRARPRVQVMRRELHNARAWARPAHQIMIEALDVRANQLEYQVTQASPLSVREARRLVQDFVRVQDRLGKGPIGPLSRPRSTPPPEDPTLVE